MKSPKETPECPSDECNCPDCKQERQEDEEAYNYYRWLEEIENA